MQFYIVSHEAHEALLAADVALKLKERPDIVCYCPTHPDVRVYGQFVPDSDPTDFDAVFKVLDEASVDISEDTHVLATQRAPYMFIMKYAVPDAFKETIFRDMIRGADTLFPFETNDYWGFTMVKGQPITDIAGQNPGVALMTIGDVPLPDTQGHISLSDFLSQLG